MVRLNDDKEMVKSIKEGLKRTVQDTAHRGKQVYVQRVP